MQLYTFGRTIYADKVTGVILHDSGEVGTTMFDYEENKDDWNNVKVLLQRSSESVIVIKLAVGEREEDFNERVLLRVNPITYELEFS